MTNTEKKMIDAIRNDPKIGYGTCSMVDECMTDEEVLERLRAAGATTPAEALRVMKFGENLWREQADEAITLQDFEAETDTTYALVFGHEINGVQQTVVDRCDACIEIPQYGTKHSFNISVSAGIVLWEITRKLEMIKKRAIQ